MGAHEFGGTGLQPYIGAVDDDRGVDLADLAQLLARYGTASGANRDDGDVDCDGDAELADLAMLLAVYGTTFPQHHGWPPAVLRTPIPAGVGVLSRWNGYGCLRCDLP